LTSQEIILGIARNPGNAISYSATGGIDPELRLKVFERDQHTCTFCGFQAQKYQDIRFIDNNSANTRLDNMQTACMYCAQCFDLEKTASMKSGVLIWLPEISQADLSHIARAIYVARISQGPMAECARAALDTLMGRRTEALNRIGTDDPYILATIMRDFLGAKQYAVRAQKLNGVRLFPLDRRIVKEGELEFNQFPQILAYWRSKDGPFGGKAPNVWRALYEDALKAA
jgi:intracellular multiplication protein IcmJ